MLMEPRSLYRSRWFMPAFSTALGLLDPRRVRRRRGCRHRPGRAGNDGRASALIFLIGGRAQRDARPGLGGPGRDERWEMIDPPATAFAGSVLIAALIACWLWNIAHDGDGSPYGQLMAVTGIAYIAGVALLRWRAAATALPTEPTHSAAWAGRGQTRSAPQRAFARDSRRVVEDRRTCSGTALTPL